MTQSSDNPTDPPAATRGHASAWFERPFSAAPRPAMILTLAGMLPFMISALIVVVTPRGVLFNETAYLSLTVYSAAILSFLGGTRWGVELARRPQATRWPVMLLSVLPPLAGWLTLVVNPNPRLAMAVFVAGFTALLAWDLWSIVRDRLPGWYASLRILASAGAILSLLLVLWTRGPA